MWKEFLKVLKVAFAKVGIIQGDKKNMPIGYFSEK